LGTESWPLARGAEALLAATGTGTLSLLLGSRGSELAEVISALGGRTVTAGAGGHDPGLSPSSANDRPEVSVDSSARLPFAAESFDSVFAPYLSVADLGRHTHARSSMDLAEECARVLKPGGRLVLSLPNPLVTAALRWAPGPRRTPYLGRSGPLPYSARRLARLLRGAGFEAVVGFALWPRIGAWERIIPETDGRFRRRLALARSARRPVTRMLAVLGIAPGRLVVAQMPRHPGLADRGAATPSLEAILRAKPWDGATVSTPTVRVKGGQIALASVGDAFFKIALTPDAAQRQRVETANHARLRDSPAADFTLEVMRQGELGALSFVVHPAAEPLQHSDESRCIGAQVEAFALLSVGAELQPARTTTSWARIFTGPSRSALERLGAGDLCLHMEQAAGDKRVLAGIVHGDLHLHNVMTVAGRTVLIDWDCSEWRAPLVLDRCNGVYRLLARRLRPTLPERWHRVALDLMVRRDASVPLLEYIDDAAVELAWPEVMLLHVLNTSSWRLTRRGAVDRRAEREIREHLAVCRALIARP
jgi:SAM-dependent methyltransferase